MVISDALKHHSSLRGRVSARGNPLLKAAQPPHFTGSPRQGKYNKLYVTPIHLPILAMMNSLSASPTNVKHSGLPRQMPLRPPHD